MSKVGADLLDAGLVARVFCRALVGVLTLTLGIGAISALFGNVEAVLLKSLPYKEASRLRIPPCPRHLRKWS